MKGGPVERAEGGLAGRGSAGNGDGRHWPPDMLEEVTDHAPGAMGHRLDVVGIGDGIAVGHRVARGRRHGLAGHMPRANRAARQEDEQRDERGIAAQSVHGSG